MTTPEITVVVFAVGLTAALSALAIVVLRYLRTGELPTMPRAIQGFPRVAGRPAGLAVLLLFLVASVPFLGIFWFILIFVAVETWRRSRATRQYGLLCLLTVSAERSMPLVPAIRAFARESGGPWGRKADHFAQLLDAGVPLPEALQRCPGLLPRYAAPTIRVGYETGTLAQAMRRAAMVQQRDEPIWMAMQARIAYLVLVPAFGLSIVTFIVLKIVPQFAKIFSDFEITLPSLTIGLIEVARFSTNFWILLLPLFLLGPLLLFYLPVRYFGWTDWDLPWIDSLTRRLDSAEILDILAMTAQQQRPIVDGVDSLAACYPKQSIRWRLRLAADDIMLGNDWCESLCTHGLIRQPELAILRAAERVGNLSWAMTEMADSIRRRLVYRVQAAAHVFFPLVVVLLGLAVAFIVVALFMPLVTLIQSLT